LYIAENICVYQHY